MGRAFQLELSEYGANAMEALARRAADAVTAKLAHDRMGSTSGAYGGAPPESGIPEEPASHPRLVARTPPLPRSSARRLAYLLAAAFALASITAFAPLPSARNLWRAH